MADSYASSIVPADTILTANELEVYKCMFIANPEVKLIEIDTYRTVMFDTPFDPELFEYQKRNIGNSIVTCIVYKGEDTRTIIFESSMPFLYYIDRNLRIHIINHACYMFAGAKSVNAIYCNRMNMSRVIDASHMFDGCVSLKTVICDKWDTSLLMAADYMFYKCVNLNIAMINNWLTRNLHTTTYMFAECYNLKSVGGDLSKWSTRNLMNVSHMFEGVMNLTPDVKWNYLPKRCNYTNAFTGQLRDTLRFILKL